jgi:hypothetical protein
MSVLCPIRVPSLPLEVSPQQSCCQGVRPRASALAVPTCFARYAVLYLQNCEIGMYGLTRSFNP